jgi:hypothetical protein
MKIFKNRPLIRNFRATIYARKIENTSGDEIIARFPLIELLRVGFDDR